MCANCLSKDSNSIWENPWNSIKSVKRERAIFRSHRKKFSVIASQISNCGSNWQSIFFAYKHVLIMMNNNKHLSTTNCTQCEPLDKKGDDKLIICLPFLLECGNSFEFSHILNTAPLVVERYRHQRNHRDAIVARVSATIQSVCNRWYLFVCHTFKQNSLWASSMQCNKRKNNFEFGLSGRGRSYIETYNCKLVYFFFFCFQSFCCASLCALCVFCVLACVCHVWPATMMDSSHLALLVPALRYNNWILWPNHQIQFTKY